MRSKLRLITAKLSGLSQFRRALSFVWEGAPGWTTANAVFVFIQGLMPLLTLALYKLLLDAVTSGVVSHGSAAAVHRVVVLAACTIAANLLTTLLGSLGVLVNELQSQQVTEKMQELLHTRSIQADLEYYENGEYFNTLHRAQADAPFRPMRIVSTLVLITQNLVALIGIAGLLLVSIHWEYAAVVVLATLPGMFVKFGYSKQMYAWLRDNTERMRRSDDYNALLTSAHHAKELRLFGIGELFVNRAKTTRQELRKSRFAALVSRSLADSASQGFATAAVYGLFGTLAVAAAHGSLKIGALAMFFAAFQRGQGAMQGVLNGFADLYENSLFLNNLYEFLDLQPKLSQPVLPKPFPTEVRNGIRVERVSFSYAGTGREVLKDVSFEIAAGETIALVGENGSGKTTLVKLLCRLYDPTEGSITIDGTPLGEFDIAELRKQYSVVFQDYAKYNATVRENIRFGNIERPESDLSLEIAACRASGESMIARLPMGYDTPLGSSFTGGVELSIGQWQKIAIARAFYREAQIVVMDEPTSALDATAEHEVFESFRQLAAGRTAILISHRLSTVRMADRIIVLENGRIVEQGTHDELVRLNGSYARLFELQARSYTGAFAA